MGVDPKNPPQPKKPQLAPVRAAKVSSELATLDKRLHSKEVEAALKATRKRFGAMSVAGFCAPMPPVEVVPFGYPELDLMVCGGGNPERAGIPRGRTVEIFGAESGGKTTLCMSFIKTCQRLGKLCVFVDMEHSMDGEYATANGIDTARWVYLVPNDGEECVDMTTLWLNTGADLVVVDSLGAMFPRSNVDKEADKAQKMAGRANLINRMLEQAHRPVMENKAILMAINQIRANMQAGMNPYAQQDRTPGGKMVEHAYSLRLRVSKGQKVYDGTRVSGIGMKVKCTKSKIGPPLGECELLINFGTGISEEASVLEAALRADVLTRKSGRIYFNDELCADSRDEMKAKLRSDRELLERIRTATLAVPPADEAGYATDYDSGDTNEMVLGEEESLDG